MGDTIPEVNYDSLPSKEAPNESPNESTLRNEIPKSERSVANAMKSENTLRNEQPISDRKQKSTIVPRTQPLKKEVPSRLEAPKDPQEEDKNVPSGDPLEKHQIVDSSGKVKWDKTHFILAIESGSRYNI